MVVLLILAVLLVLSCVVIQGEISLYKLVVAMGDETVVSKQVVKKLQANGINPTLAVTSASGPPGETGLASDVATREASDFFKDLKCARVLPQDMKVRVEQVAQIYNDEKIEPQMSLLGIPTLIVGYSIRE